MSYIDFIFSTFNNVNVVNVKDFFRNLSSQSVVNSPHLLNVIKNRLQKLKRIGQPSVFGEIYGGPNYVIKIMKLCSDPNSVFCQMIREGNIFFSIPETLSQKQILLGPNYIVESVIGYILANSEIKNFTRGFAETKVFQFDSANAMIYTVMEKLQEGPKKYTNNDILSTVFQITHSLYTAQKLSKFVHYDFHTGNYGMVRKKDLDTINVYKLKDGRFAYILQDYENVIIDFGRSRMETKKYTILGRDPIFLGSRKIREKSDYYGFNPYIDMYEFMVTFTELGTPFLDVDHGMTINKLKSMFYNADSSLITSIQDYITENSEYSWYPNPERTAMEDVV